MTCPVCEEKTKTTNTAAVYGSVIRQRKCPGCGYVFYTEETDIPEEEGAEFRRILNARRQEQYIANKKEREKEGKR